MVTQVTQVRQPQKAPPIWVLFVSTAAAMSGFLFGYDSAVVNGAGPGIRDRFGLGEVSFGVIISTALLGCAVGAMAAGRLADWLGRRAAMRIAAVLFLVSAIGSMFSGMAWLLGFWRVIGGTAIGVASVIGPLYIAEVSPPAYRGRLASLQQLAIVVGIAVSQLVNYLIAAEAGGGTRDRLLGLEAWQWMLGVCAVPAACYFLLVSAIPESPRFLVASGREAQARAVFHRLEGEGADPDGRVSEIRAAIAGDHKQRFGDLLERGSVMLPIVWIGIGLAVFQQFVGINVVFYYSNVLWQSVGAGQSDALLRSFSTGVVNIVGTFVAIVLIDQIGRKALLLAGSAGMAVALGAEAWAFSQLEHHGDQVSLSPDVGLVALVAAHVFVFFFALSWGVVLWVLLGEMFPSRIRSVAMSLATAFNWIANWLITISFPSLSAWNLSATYAGYAFFAAVSFFFVWFLVQETKGKTLEEA